MKNISEKFKMIGCAILGLTAVLGLVGPNVMMFSEQSKAESYMAVTGAVYVSEVNQALEELSTVVTMLSEGFVAQISSAEELRDRRTREKYADILSVQASKAFKTAPLSCSLYLNYDPTFKDHTAGFLIMSNPDGSIQSTGGLEVPIVLNNNNLADYNWYLEPIQYGSALWLEPYYDEVIQDTVISYVNPIYVEDGTVGIIGMDIRLQTLIDYTQKLVIGTDAQLGLINRGGERLGDNPVPDSSDYLSREEKLCNGMKLEIYVPRQEIYSIRYSMPYYFFVILSAIVLVVAASIMIWMILSAKGDQRRSVNQKVVSAALIGVATVIVLVQVVVTIASTRSLRFNYRPTIDTADYGYTDTLHVVTDENYAPFSYYDENGNICGYDIAMIYQIAQLMEKNVELELIPWNDCLKAIRTGKADVILGVECRPEKDNTMTYSVCVEKDYINVYGREEIDSIYSIMDAKLGAIVGGELVDAYGLIERSQAFGSYEEAFGALKNGEVDYVIARETVADMYLRQNAIEAKKVYELMQSEISYGVSNNRTELLADMNQALETLKNNGTADELYHEWVTDQLTDQSLWKFIVDNKWFYSVTTFVFLVCALSGLLNFSIMRNNSRWRRLSETDFLTGINNRGGGERKIRSLIEKKIPGMFCLMDVDKFKTINDTYGHAVGDQVLVAVAECMKSAFRDRDIIMRLGGDEFAVYVPNVLNEEVGVKIIERLFDELYMTKIDEMDGREIHLSVGATFYQGMAEDDFAGVYRRADHGMYLSKKVVGNRYHFIENEE